MKVWNKFVLIFFVFPTLNADELHNRQSASDVAKPFFSHAGGFYNEPFELEISPSNEDAVIYYTLDGSQPSDTSFAYDGPITIGSGKNDENYFSEITGTAPQWVGPEGEVFKITVVRAIQKTPDGTVSDIATHSYIIDENNPDRYSLPVVSIAVDEDSLFDYERGIYVKGKIYDEFYDPNTSWWHRPANYTQRGVDWERPMHIEFFDEDGTVKIAQDAGLRIHGGASRSYPQKSLRLYSRSDYGTSRFTHQFFPDKSLDDYNRLILRNSGNDWFHTMFRDAVIQRVVGGLDFATQAYRPVVVFLNGEYWGIYNIRERFDKHYLETNYGVDRENVDLLTHRRTVKEGDNVHYDAMLNYIHEHGLKENEHYQHIQTLMDVGNFLDYNIAHIYARNTDWPGNNIDYWRHRTDEYEPDAPYGHDGRWRWLFYDADFGFGLRNGVDDAQHNTIDFATETNGPTWPNPPWSTFLLRSFLENEQFRISFINRFADLLNSTFKPARIISIIDEMQAVIEPEMEEHIHRWPVIASFEGWKNNVDIMRIFAQKRPGYQRQHILEYFELEDSITVSIDVSDLAAGAVQINSLVIDNSTEGLHDPGKPYPWDGVYFAGVPVQLVAHAYPGYEFTGWTGIDEESDSTEIVLEDDVNITANFEYKGDHTDDPKNPEPYNLADGPYRFNYWPEDKPEGSFPPNMVFLQTDMTDPGLHDEMTGVYHIPEDEYHSDDEENIGYPYKLTRRTRLTGWNERGITFINTGRERDLGAAVLALNTTGLDSITVSWTSGTIIPNERVYAIRLQYRVGAGGPFSDVLDSDGNPVEYVRNELAEHYQFMEPAVLPEEVNDREYVQLRWKYYHVTGSSGPRAKLLLDNILVTSGEHPHTLYPEPHDLSEETYEFKRWYPDEPEGSFPPNMVFLQSRMDDPRLDDEMVEPHHIPFFDDENNAYHADDQGMFGSVYQLTGRTRITGLLDDGVAFINTGRGRDLGAAVLGLNTSGQHDISVEWTGGTVIPNSRMYNIRLQFRIGREGPFVDVQDAGLPVEYERNEITGHSQSFGPVTLPEAADNQPYIQLRWKYYYTGDRLDEDVGRRDMLRVGNIRVTSVTTGVDNDDEGLQLPESYYLTQNYPNPFNPQTTIGYGLPERSYVQIIIYSVLGEEVATIVDEVRDAGSHEVQWSIPPEGFASGVYYYRIEATQVGNPAEKFIETKPMVILK